MNFYTINRGIFKRFHRFFVYQSNRKKFRNSIKRKNKDLNCKPLSRLQEKAIKDYYSTFGFKNICTDWHRYYTHITGKFYKEYIPEDFFYNVIEPNLNMRTMFPGLTDKNILDKLFPNVLQPKNIIKNINGTYIDAVTGEILTFNNAVKKCLKYQKMVIKPSIESGGGKNVNVLEINNGLTDFRNLALDKIFVIYDKNFIVQECLDQHEKMIMLNESSINTLRIKTIIINDEIICLSTVVRIGLKGSKVDNMRIGGYLFKVNTNGKLYDRGYFGNGLEIRKKDLYFDTNDFEIPNYNNAISKVKNLHKQMPHFKMISWDIAINPRGECVLIEYNVFGQGIGQFYGPLFGEYTDELLSKCKVRLFSYS